MNFGAILICLLFTPPLSSSPVSCRAPRVELFQTFTIYNLYNTEIIKKFAKIS